MTLTAPTPSSRPGLGRDLLATLSLGLPLVGSQVTQMLVGVTDALMLGRYSVPALAAGTLGASSFFTVFILGMGLALAVMPLAAQAAGRGDEVRMRRVTRMGLWLAVMFGLGALPLFWFSGAVLTALGQTPEVAANGQAYLRIAGLGMVPALLMATFRSHLSALERTRVVLWATLAGALVNAGLNWLLIFGNWGLPELGIRGAAIASVAVQAISCALLAAYAVRGPGMARFELLKNIHRPDWPVMGELFRLGWPIGLTQLAESGLFTATALMLGWLGAVPLAAHGVAIQIAGLTFMVHVGLSSAVTVRVGTALGRDDRAAVARASVAAAILSAGAVVLAVVLYLTAGRWLIGLFVSPDDPQAGAILDLGVRLLMLAGLFQAVDAAQVMALGMLRGLQDTRRPMVYAVVAYWVLGLPAGYVLGFPMGLGPEGVWLGLVVGLAAAGVLLSARFVGLMRAIPAPGASPVTSRS